MEDRAKSTGSWNSRALNVVARRLANERHCQAPSREGLCCKARGVLLGVYMQPCIHPSIHPSKQANKQAISKQTSKQTNKQTYIHTYVYTLCLLYSCSIMFVTIRHVHDNIWLWCALRCQRHRSGGSVQRFDELSVACLYMGLALRHWVFRTPKLGDFPGLGLGFRV